jgi:hypothetical protein
MGLTGQKARCGRGCVFLEALENNPIPLLEKSFSSFEKLPESLGSWPLPASSKPAAVGGILISLHSDLASRVTSLSPIQFSTLKYYCGDLGPTQIIFLL